MLPVGVRDRSHGGPAQKMKTAAAAWLHLPTLPVESLGRAMGRFSPHPPADGADRDKRMHREPTTPCPLRRPRR